MDYYGELLSAYGDRAVFIGNLFITLVAIAWHAGMPSVELPKWTKAKEEQSVAGIVWRSWLGFWVFTAVFYLLKSIELIWQPWWVPVLALHAASLCLILGLFDLRVLPEAGRRWDYQPRVHTIAFGVLVLGISQAADNHAKEITHTTGYHQAIDCALFTAWAWKVRGPELTEASLVILAYGVTQLPLQPMLNAVNGHVSGDPYAIFVSKTFVLYGIAKFALLTSVLKVIRTSRSAEKTNLMTDRALAATASADSLEGSPDREALSSDSATESAPLRGTLVPEIVEPTALDEKEAAALGVGAA